MDLMEKTVITLQRCPFQLSQIFVVSFTGSKWHNLNAHTRRFEKGSQQPVLSQRFENFEAALQINQFLYSAL